MHVLFRFSSTHFCILCQSTTLFGHQSLATRTNATLIVIGRLGEAALSWRRNGQLSHAHMFLVVGSVICTIRRTVRETCFLPFFLSSADLLCAKWQDGKWYRAVMTKFKDRNLMTVRYIDFGNEEDVVRDRMCPFPRSLLAHPIYCLPCRLDGAHDYQMLQSFQDRDLEMEMVRVENKVPLWFAFCSGVGNLLSRCCSSFFVFRPHEAECQVVWSGGVIVASSWWCLLKYPLPFPGPDPPPSSLETSPPLPT